MLELKSVSRSYCDTAETVQAVRDVSLSVQGGEMVGLFGPSGSGKTTLLLLAAGILQPDQGTVLIEDQDISKLGSRESTAFRLNHIGFVFQSFQLLQDLSALDNVALPLMLSGMSRREAHKRVVSLLDRVGMVSRFDHLPAQLSGGERQLVAVAKALACEPRVILADEPTGSLDTHRTHEILDLLVSVTAERKVATLLVSHDPNAQRYASRAYHLRDGELVSGAEPQREADHPGNLKLALPVAEDV